MDHAPASGRPGLPNFFPTINSPSYLSESRQAAIYSSSAAWHMVADKDAPLAILLSIASKYVWRLERVQNLFCFCLPGLSLMRVPFLVPALLTNSRCSTVISCVPRCPTLWCLRSRQWLHVLALRQGSVQGAGALQTGRF